MMTVLPAKDYFNKGHFLMKLQGRISVRKRREMLSHIPLKKEITVLEVGATPDTDLMDSNFFSLQARQIGCAVSMTSPEDCSKVAKDHGVEWLPFNEFLHGTRQFDVVISSAVLEHVGELREQKLDHLRSLARVARRWAVVTTPSRSHWIEFHTKLPFIHWLPKPAHRRILDKLGLHPWDNPDHLDLVNPSQFHSLMDAAFQFWHISYRYIRFLGCVSNLMAIAERVA